MTAVPEFRARSIWTTLVALPLVLLPACQGPDAATDTATEWVTTQYAPQNRPDVMGMTGAVSSDHPLATEVGLAVLRDGGTATDAIIAMAGVLSVTRPHMNGIGGDAFAIFYDGETGEVTALDASGRSGALATPGFFRDAGLDEIPNAGGLSVSVPGAVAGWVDAHQRFGVKPFAELLEPAIRFARDGFAVSTRLAQDFVEQGDRLNEHGQALYLPGGGPPPVGSLLRNPELATSLEAIAMRGKAGFYEGEIARALADFIEAEGGHLRVGDFAAHTSDWVDPLRGDYLGHTFLVMPPSTQGPAQLAMMEMSKGFGLEAMGHNSADYLHTMIEVTKLAFADRDRWMADRDLADVPVDRLLDTVYLRERGRLVDPARAALEVSPGFGEDLPGLPEATNDAGDTVYLTAVDQWGNAVSWIQSNFAGFGSGLLEPTTGILLQNRGALYTLQDGHPNQVAPGKRPYHTLTPMMALGAGGGFAFTLGTPGGDSQPQSILQIVHNMLVFGMRPQVAVEVARFRSLGGARVSLEDRVSADEVRALADLGHEVRLVEGWTATFGGAQMIVYDPVTGVLTAAADPRREAYALAY